MAFEYKGFKIERKDDLNVCLYRWCDIAVSVGGKKTGEVRKDWKLFGYYNTFLGALRRLYDYLLEDGKSVEDLKEISSHFKKEFDFVVLQEVK